MSMNPYNALPPKEAVSQILEVRFNNGIMAAIHDSYCENPSCSCSDVALDFVEIDKNRIALEKLFSIRIDISNWTINSKNIVSRKVDCEKMIDEFITDLDADMKEIFITRFMESKKPKSDTPLQWFDELDAEDSTCFGYAEVFEDRDADQFVFKYKDAEYFVDDHYCSNPECKCNEVILTFAKIDPVKSVQEPKFVVRMPLGAGRYEVEYNPELSKVEMDDIVKVFREHFNNDFSLLRNRYKKMKEFGDMRLKRMKSKLAKPVVNNLKIGRNDPCPCGSGKKFKKCCGSI